MLPQYERLDSSKVIFRIRFGIYGLAICTLPFFSFVFCVGYSLWSYFERATATHCNVRNYLPSISAAIGNYQPQRFVWQLAILIQVIPRLTVTYQYYRLYEVIVRKNRRPIAYTACIFNVVENLALVGLSLWTSIDDYGKECQDDECFVVLSQLTENFHSRDSQDLFHNIYCNVRVLHVHDLLFEQKRTKKFRKIIANTTDLVDIEKESLCHKCGQLLLCRILFYETQCSM